MGTALRIAILHANVRYRRRTTLRHNYFIKRIKKKKKEY